MTPELPPLDLETLDPDPVAVFQRWLEEARARGVPNPEDMVLATAASDGRPSVRWVLLKDLPGGGPFTFYTNLQSQKAVELDRNPHAALAFYWRELGRQVRVEGRVTRVPDVEADAYFHTRHRESQISAWASHQSRPIESREAMDEHRARVATQFDGREVPRPPHWGGYRLEPSAIEFWQARDFRYHDRVRFEREPGGLWERVRLQP